MTKGIRVFFIEPTGKHQRSLRRYSNGRHCPKIPGDYSYCNASVYLDVIEQQEASGNTWPHDDPRWPKHCERCGGQFIEEDHWQLKHDAIYRCHDDHSTQFPLHMAPIGACWNAYWMADIADWCGDDGRALIVRVPGPYDWHIDSRASNCTMPNEKTHKCWVRHGRPEDGALHVDKNGHTCGAGAGSIMPPGGWHGFLHNGFLIEC